MGAGLPAVLNTQARLQIESARSYSWSCLVGFDQRLQRCQHADPLLSLGFFASHSLETSCIIASSILSKTSLVYRLSHCSVSILPVLKGWSGKQHFGHGNPSKN